MDPSVSDRAGYIGGSDVAAIMSLSSYATPFQVFAQKVGVEVTEARDPVREEKFEFGHALEPVIAERFAHRYKIRVERAAPAFKRHEKYPFVAGHVDFIAPDLGAIVECKNVEYESEEWGTPRPLDEDSSELVPIYYLTQVDHYMLLHGKSFAYLVALFGGCRLKVYRINRDPYRESLILRAEELFWSRVVNDDPPPFSGVDDLLISIRSGYTQSYNAKRAKLEKIKIQLDATANELLSTIYAERRKQKAAEQKRKVARLALVEHLRGKTGYLFVGDEKHGSFLTQERESFDEFSFKLAHPDIHAQYARRAIVGPVLRLTKDREEEEEQKHAGDEE